MGIYVVRGVQIFGPNQPGSAAELTADDARCLEPKSCRGSFLQLGPLFFALAAFVPSPALYGPFPGVKLQLFLNALSLPMFVHLGD